MDSKQIKLEKRIIELETSLKAKEEFVEYLKLLLDQLVKQDTEYTWIQNSRTPLPIDERSQNPWTISTTTTSYPIMSNEKPFGTSTVTIPSTPKPNGYQNSIKSSDTTMFDILKDSIKLYRDTIERP